MNFLFCLFVTSQGPSFFIGGMHGLKPNTSDKKLRKSQQK
jgi:hypothetical protein